MVAPPMLLSDDVSRLIHSWSEVYFLMISARVSDVLRSFRVAAEGCCKTIEAACSREPTGKSGDGDESGRGGADARSGAEGDARERGHHGAVLLA